MINPDSAESINLPQIRELLKSPNGSFRIIDKRRKVVRSDSGGAGETGESNERVVEDTVVPGKGGFHVVAKIIRELKSHMIPYKFKCSHWLKLQHSDWRAIFHQ